MQRYVGILLILLAASAVGQAQELEEVLAVAEQNKARLIAQQTALEAEM